MKKVIRFISSVIFIGVILFLFKECTQYLFFSSPEDISYFLSQNVAEQNKNLPRKIDSVTRLDSISSSNMEINSYYTTSTNRKMSSSNKDILKKNLRPKLLNGYCNSEDTESYVEYDIDANYFYYDMNGSIIIKIKIQASEC